MGARVQDGKNIAVIAMATASKPPKAALKPCFVTNHSPFIIITINLLCFECGKTVIRAILDIISKKLGETGKQILIKHLEDTELSPEEMTVKDIPKLIPIIQEVLTPIFGVKSANEITNKIKKLGKK